MKIIIPVCVVLIVVLSCAVTVLAAEGQHNNPHRGHLKPVHKRQAWQRLMRNHGPTTDDVHKQQGRPVATQSDSYYNYNPDDYYYYYDSDDNAGGALYTRWGSTECPDTAELVYKGWVGGSYYSKSGGGANHLCMVEDPSYYTGTQSLSRVALVYGTEYQHPVTGVHDQDVPCAVCQSHQSYLLTVPGKSSCPDDKWELEYTGYIMADYEGHRKSTFECVDKNMEVISNSGANRDGSLFYHASVNCQERNALCQSYDKTKPLTCAVCSK